MTEVRQRVWPENTVQEVLHVLDLGGEIHGRNPCSRETKIVRDRWRVRWSLSPERFSVLRLFGKWIALRTLRFGRVRVDDNATVRTITDGIAQLPLSRTP